jgi:Tol biopolymer transport system component
MNITSYRLGAAALALAASAGVAFAAPGDTIRISEAFGGGDANDASDNGYWSHISPDGRYSVFASYASNLVPIDTNAGQDVFIRDNVTGVTTLVSVDSTGLQHAFSTYCNACTVSADGVWVSFDTDGAWTSIPADTNALPDVYLKNMATGELRWVSQAAGGGPSAAGQSYSAWVSNNGAFIAFESSASELVAGDTAGWQDIFLYNIASNSITRVSVAAGGGETDGDSFQAGISADWRYLCFDSNATNLVSSDTNGVGDVFRKDMSTGDVVVCSLMPGRENMGTQTLNHGISHDGNRVCFLSNDPAVSAPDGRRNGVVRDIAAGVTYIGSAADGGVNIPGGTVGSIGLSPDGGYFSWRGSADGYVPGDTNGINDVFVHELATGRVQLGSPAVGGGLQMTGTMAFTVVSEGGRFVQYASNASDLVPNDNNFFDDIFRHEYGWEIPCDPDVNQDGNVDQDDVAYLINVIGGGANPTGIDPDFNHDGNVDQDDVAAIINTIGGGGCP